MSLVFSNITFSANLADIDGCCEDKSAHHGSCAKYEWCSSNPRECVLECQGSWDGSKCIFPSHCTTSRNTCNMCGGRWHPRKIFLDSTDHWLRLLEKKQEIIYWKIVVFFIGCTWINVGISFENFKSLEIPEGYKCPEVVDKSNWLTPKNVKIFSVRHFGNVITVTRMDSNGGWNQNFTFPCCSAGMYFIL